MNAPAMIPTDSGARVLVPVQMLTDEELEGRGLEYMEMARAGLLRAELDATRN